ncbi:MAG TPA: Mut7-C RNAse domain-containing protein [Telluria sp.]|nr:Mut7-C RNAse domain-containing protein [Telluria sp.]
MRPSVTATFRFYAELNEFLERSRRGHEFTLRCAQAATAKHMVEALGVPHTEVALLLVNGEPAPLDRLLSEGDRLSVYPVFGCFEAAPLQGNSPAPARFVADAHLGGLARMLRMAGFDTLYDNGFGDADIERLGGDQHRTVLTRDRELLKRRGVEHGCYVHALAPAEQFREIADRLRLAGLARPFSLCLHCNEPLRDVPMEDVLDRLPPSVRDTQREFRTCGKCGRVYWKGSHWKRMSALLTSALSGAC